MLRSTRNMLGHRLNATDGEIGRCVDFLVDSERWLARYLVVECAAKLGGRRVLISPYALNKADWTSRRMVLEGTRAQVENAPAFEGAQISRQYEMELFRHYGWSVSGLAPVPGQQAVPELETLPGKGNALCSIKEISNYEIRAEDGNVGRVDDFIVDDDTWSIPYVVAEGRNWLSPRKVLVATDRILGVASEERQVEVALPSSAIEDGPDYDPAGPILTPRVMTDAAPATPVPSSARPPALSAWFLGLAAADMSTRGLRAAIARIIQG